MRIECPSSYMISWNPWIQVMMIRNSWKIQRYDMKCYTWRCDIEYMNKDLMLITLRLPMASNPTSLQFMNHNRDFMNFYMKFQKYITRIIEKLYKAFPEETKNTYLRRIIWSCKSGLTDKKKSRNRWIILSPYSYHDKIWDRKRPYKMVKKS